MRRFAEVNGRRRVEAMLNGIVNEKIAGYIIKVLVSKLLKQPDLTRLI